jgi:hypothetical protein
MKLWICSKWIKDGSPEFQGVFDDEEKAIAACISSDYGIGPAILNERIQDETTEWEGFYYPKK